MGNISIFITKKYILISTLTRMTTFIETKLNKSLNKRTLTNIDAENTKRAEIWLIEKLEKNTKYGNTYVFNLNIEMLFLMYLN